MENTTPLPSASFYCREGSSDKVYHMEVAEVEDGFLVKFQYGRRGATLKPGIKPAKAVTLEKALVQFESMCRERLSKGYTPSETAGATALELVGREKSGMMPQLLNAIDEETLEVLLNDANICMQEKEDGERVMISRKADIIIASNKLGLTRPLLQSLHDAILALPCAELILDGELVGEQYRIFDLLSLNEESYYTVGYTERYAAYANFFAAIDSPSLKIVRGWFTTEEKKQNFDRIKTTNGEGVVFKKIDKHYSTGRPTSGGSQLKYKFTESATCIVDSISEKRRSVSLALLDDKQTRVLVGNVSVPSNKEVPTVGDLVEVRYLYRYEDGALFQPFLLGTRQDVELQECTLAQIRRVKLKSQISIDEEE